MSNKMRLFTIILGVNIMYSLPCIFVACCPASTGSTHEDALAELDRAFEDALADVEGVEEEEPVFDWEAEGEIIAEGTFLFYRYDDDWTYEVVIQYLDTNSILQNVKCDDNGQWSQCHFSDGWYEVGDPMRVTEIDDNHRRFEKYFQPSSTENPDRRKQ